MDCYYMSTSSNTNVPFLLFSPLLSPSPPPLSFSLHPSSPLSPLLLSLFLSPSIPLSHSLSSFLCIFSRIPISQTFIDMVIGRLRSDDIYNQVRRHVFIPPPHVPPPSISPPSLLTYHRLQPTQPQSTAAQRWQHRRACCM